jgi:hypothetical protein
MHTEFWWRNSLGKRWRDNSEMDLRELGYEDGRWMAPARDIVQVKAFILAASNLWALLL